MMISCAARFWEGGFLGAAVMFLIGGLRHWWYIEEKKTGAK